MTKKEGHPEVEFDDGLINLFWKLHRFKCLQWLILLLIRIRDKLDFHNKFIKKPITKEVDEMDNCHFRTLYKRNHFNDNYTDPDFLCSMQLNTNLNYYTLGEAIFASTQVVLHICPCILYAIMFYHLRYDKISPETVFGLFLVCTLVGYLIFQYCHWFNTRRSSSSPLSTSTITLNPSKISLFEKMINGLQTDCLSFVCCSGFSYLLVPILRTVTQSIDTRTVYAVCGIMFGVHLLCNDYGLKAVLVSSALSMNSAIFSVICLASRLQSDEHCLALISFGVMSFICYPIWGQEIQSRFQHWNSSASLVLLVIVTITGFCISWGIFLLIAILILMIVVVAPVLYVCYVQYKVNIHGPWDEAQPELDIDMNEIERGFEKRRSKRENSHENSGNPTKDKVKDTMNVSKNQSAVKTDEKKIEELEAKGIGMVL